MGGLLTETYIRKCGPIQCTARSPDHNPLDFFLWGNLKQSAYTADIRQKSGLRNATFKLYCDLVGFGPRRGRDFRPVYRIGAGIVRNLSSY